MEETRIVDTIAREMPTGVVALDGKKRVVYANPFFLKSFAATTDLRGRVVSEVIKDNGLLDTVNDFIKKDRVEAREIEIAEKDRFFKVRLVPFEQGRAVLLFLRDITEEKRVEAIKKDFVANVSHELRTPLASIKGYAETLLDGASEDRVALKEFLKIIDKHAARMSRIIDDLLVLSRLESHEMTIVPKPLDMAELVYSVVQGITRSAEGKDIRLSYKTDEKSLKVMADHDRLEQVMMNLLDNAIKYTASGGSIEVRVYAEDDSVRVDVVDTGIGIPQKDIPRIFERFYRVDKARSRELGGTGLGLAIVKHILQGHNGRVWVESELGKGSTFSFTLKRTVRGI
ncbi:MAG: phosphate regulon sensor histidine kinase PhoR [Deltaproteobacteria bacterium]|nr:phosphate regulon sensor histidine kinase PhoR [Deltaproteobacteria bacterium]